MGEEHKRTVSTEGFVPVSPSIILYDDIEGTFKWSGSGTGTDWVADKYAGTVQVNNGSYCLRMKTRTTTPAVGDYVDVFRCISTRQWKTIRFSMFFRPTTQAGYNYMEIDLRNYTGTEFLYESILWNRPTQTWRYYSYTGAWVDIPGGYQPLHENTYHRLSLVVDYEKREIKQFQCDSLFLDNLNLKFRVTPSTVPSYLMIYILLSSGAAATQELYLDDISLVEEA